MSHLRTKLSCRSVRQAHVFACALVTALAVSGLASAQTYSVLHNFTGGPGGAAPYTGVVLNGAGNLLGTTAAGGGGSCISTLGTGCGIAFELNPSNGLFTTLWQFTGSPADGAGPASVLLGPGSTLYVSTMGGGRDTCRGNTLELPGCGTIVSLSPPVAPPRSIQENHWIETILHKFQGNPDGAAPSGNLATDSAGNLYGTTNAGGSTSVGAVFKMTHSNGGWNESLLYSFKQTLNDGGQPFGGVTFDSAGNLYGTTEAGGAAGLGVVFQLVANSGWKENLLHSFDDGFLAISGVTFDSARNLFISNSEGYSDCFGGRVFELLSGSWSYSSMHCFDGGGGIGGPYLSTMMFDQAGNLYGTTFSDGSNSKGSVFKLTPSNGTWTYSSLHDFTGGSDGGFPIGNLVFDANGNLYGTTSCGGSTGSCNNQNDPGYGVVFKITP